MANTDDQIKILHAEVAALIQKKKNDADIIEYVISKGHERYYAELVLNNVREEISDKKNFWKTFFYGLGFLLSGILVSVSSWYFAISTGAMFYFFYWGLIVAGISIIARAFILFRK
jgi:hypothetical protein